MKLQDIKKMKVADLKSVDRGIIASATLRPSDKVAVAYNTVFTNPYKLALVIDNNKLVGIVGKSDLAKAASTQINPQVNLLDEATKSFYAIVNTDPVKIGETDTVEYLVSTLVSKDLDHIVVCDKDNKPVGIIDRYKLANEIEKLGT